mgnify:CR=1 FL=1
MWPAATAEGWKKPVLIQWQRTWEDAIAVSKATRKPILICINMDGEIASEHYAGIRYRDPEKARLFEPYVCVIASVYRHTPRDFDEKGHRVPCPRFGGVTCGEHIAIESFLYEKYFDGKRVAPRHIMVELDGKETYDVYYAWDTASVFKAIDDGIKNRKVKTQPLHRGDLTLEERIASRDSKDRAEVEQAYIQGNKEVRIKLLKAASQHSDSAPLGVLRLAIHGFDPEILSLARQNLAQSKSPHATEVINEALRVQMPKSERELLVQALERLGQASERARLLASVHRGIYKPSKVIQIEEWMNKLAGSEYPAPKQRETLIEEIDEVDARTAESPKDPEAQLALAEASLALAREDRGRRRTKMGPRTLGSYSRLLYIDARNSALEAEKLGAKGWRLDATLAVAAKGLNDRPEAVRRAEAALPLIPTGDQSYASMVVLEIIAQERQDRIIEAVRRKKRWPPEWMTEFHSAYAILSKHPLGTVNQVIHHYDFLEWLGAKGQASNCLSEGLERFPDSPYLHDRLRSRILKEQGIAGLETWYENRLKQKNASPNTEWFAGYTSIITAEYYRRAGQVDKALGAYDRAMQHFEKYAADVPERREGSDHYEAMVLAARSRIALERAEYEKAVKLMLASFKKREAAVNARNGLNLSPADTAKMLLKRLEDQKLVELHKELKTAMDALDPELLELPAFERDGQPSRRRDWRRRRR